MHSNTKDFNIGQKILFGRSSGEKTLGEVIKINRKTLKVRQLETRGTFRDYPIGTIWSVGPSLCQPAFSSNSEEKNNTQQFSAEEIRNKVVSFACAFSPENLTCDGELSRSQINMKISRLKREFLEFENALGRPVMSSDMGDDLWALGEVRSYVSPSIQRSSTSPVKESDFKIGDRVSLIYKSKKITGTVTKLNRKTIVVTPDPGTVNARYFRSDPCFLTKES